ncbi:FGGY family carbohydrate kinase [Variovorax sp. HJSM1_2]|uniref:FGGY family carbohydrate kinase n=1 Tax=Variovorax sp. HJSM1_2 TaxID=3366263 RepID=UPI003BC63868
MSSALLIGLDLGSTSFKAAVFRAEDGAVLAQTGRLVPWQRRATGACEVPQAVLDQLLQAVLQTLVAQLGAQVSDVQAIACAGHGGGLYMVTGHGALAAGMAVSSTDQRAAALAQSLNLRAAANLAAKVGCSAWAGQPTMIAAGIAQSTPAALAATPTLFFAKDYLAWCLCGEMATDYSDATTAGLLDTATGRPASLAFAVSEVPGWSAETLAPLRNSGQRLGRVLPAMATRLGLPEGLPVVMGAIDLFAAMTGAGCTQPGDTAAVFGTWCVNATVAGPPQAGEASLVLPKPGISNAVLLNADLSRMYMHNGASSMANLAWLTETVFGGEREALLTAAFTAPQGANGLRFLPFINGGQGNASAGFVGLRAFHSRADMARAVLEAVVALHAKNLNALRDAGLPRARLFALGGGAADVRIPGLLATMLNEAVYTPGADETGARGAAIFAAQALGLPTQVLLARCHKVQPLPQARTFYQGFLAEFDDLLAQLVPVVGHLLHQR